MASRHHRNSSSVEGVSSNRSSFSESSNSTSMGPQRFETISAMDEMELNSDSPPREQFRVEVDSPPELSGTPEKEKDLDKEKEPGPDAGFTPASSTSDMPLVTLQTGDDPSSSKLTVSASFSSVEQAVTQMTKFASAIASVSSPTGNRGLPPPSSTSKKAAVSRPFLPPGPVGSRSENAFGKSSLPKRSNSASKNPSSNIPIINVQHSDIFGVDESDTTSGESTPNVPPSPASSSSSSSNITLNGISSSAAFASIPKPLVQRIYKMGMEAGARESVPLAVKQCMAQVSPALQSSAEAISQLNEELKKVKLELKDTAAALHLSTEATQVRVESIGKLHVQTENDWKMKWKEFQDKVTNFYEVKELEMKKQVEQLITESKGKIRKFRELQVEEHNAQMQQIQTEVDKKLGLLDTESRLHMENMTSSTEQSELRVKDTCTSMEKKMKDAEMRMEDKIAQLDALSQKLRAEMVEAVAVVMEDFGLSTTAREKEMAENEANRRALEQELSNIRQELSSTTLKYVSTMQVALEDCKSDLTSRFNAEVSKAESNFDAYKMEQKKSLKEMEDRLQSALLLSDTKQSQERDRLKLDIDTRLGMFSSDISQLEEQMKTLSESLENHWNEFSSNVDEKVQAVDEARKMDNERMEQSIKTFEEHIPKQIAELDLSLTKKMQDLVGSIHSDFSNHHLQFTALQSDFSTLSTDFSEVKVHVKELTESFNELYCSLNLNDEQLASSLGLNGSAQSANGSSSPRHSISDSRKQVTDDDEDLLM